MHQDTMLRMIVKCASQNQTLQIPSFSHQIAHRIFVRNSNHILLDDGTVVQPLRDVMAGGADDFHPVFISLLIWIAADKRRQKRVVNIDNLIRIRLDELW